MVDTITPLLGLLLQGTGGNNNSWGENLNADVITPTETAIADALPIATTGGTLTLTADQARYAAILLTGNLASDLVIVVPNTNKVYRIVNATVGGGFFTRLKCATAATAVNIPAGSKMTTVMAIGGTPYRQDSCEVGRYVMDAASLIGDVVEANGAAYKRASLPQLFAKIGTTYGFNDVTDFKVPNAYDTGRFLRSRSASLAVGVSQANQNLAHIHGVTGAPAVGALTANTAGDHYHAAGIYDPTHSHTGNLVGFPQLTGSSADGPYGVGYTSGSINAAATGVRVNSANGIDTTYSAGSHAHNVTGSLTAGTLATANNGGTEARPESLVGILCIRY